MEKDKESIKSKELLDKITEMITEVDNLIKDYQNEKNEKKEIKSNDRQNT